MGGWASIFNITQDALRIHTRELARLQEMTASGSRVNRPSDAPVDAFKILQLQARTQSVDTYTRNLDSITESLQMASTFLQSMSTSLARVRTLATQAASGTYSQQDRVPIAGEVDAILEMVLSLANSESSGQYVFGGGSPNMSPYVATRENGKIVRVEYRGGGDHISTPVAGGIAYDTVMVGDEVFRSDSRQDPLFLGHTGARPATGTSSAQGDVWLTVRHTLTTYQGASGVAAGDSSLAGDTILGTGHALTIDAVAQTIQLDDGTPRHFDGTETDLQLTNAAGDAVYVNTTAVQAGFQGTVGIRADGSLSIDDGASSAPLGFTANDAVTDSRTGRILYVNTAQVTRAGLEPVRIRGTYDLFGALVNMRDAILNSRGLSADDSGAVLDEAVGEVKEVSSRLMETLTSAGAQLQAMASLKDNLGGMKSLAAQQTSALQDADIVDVAVELARRQTLYQMTMASAAKLLSLSLFDYLPTGT
jgi:flagellar hook-associated protein 3 FlgL